MLPYHCRAWEEESFFSSCSMVLFGFEGDEIQIRLTSLPWNLMSKADSGNYLLCKLGWSPEPLTSRASFLCCYATISPPFPLHCLSLCPPKNQPPFFFFFLRSKCQIIHFCFTALTEVMPCVRLKTWIAYTDNTDNNQEASSFTAELFWIKWTNQLVYAERDQLKLNPMFTHRLYNKGQARASEEWCKTAAVGKYEGFFKPFR